MKFIIFSPFLLFVIIFSNIANAQFATEYSFPEVYSPYWLISDDVESKIEVKNILNSTIEIGVDLYTHNGWTKHQTGFVIAARSTLSIDIKDVFLIGDQFQYSTSKANDNPWKGVGSEEYIHGSARIRLLRPIYDKNASISAWIVTTNSRTGSGFVTPFFSSRENRQDTVHHAVWWLPDEFTKNHYYFVNPNDRQLEIVTTIQDQNGVQSVVKDHVEAHSSYSITIDKNFFPDLSGVIGTVSFETKIEHKSFLDLVGRGVVSRTDTGATSPISIHKQNSSKVRSTPYVQLNSPSAYFGRLDALIDGSDKVFHPHLLVANRSSNSLHIALDAYGMNKSGDDTKINVITIDLESNSARHIDLFSLSSTAPLADGLAGLDISHNGMPGDLLVELISISEDNRLIYYDLFLEQMMDKATSHVGVSYSIKNDDRSFFVLKNITESQQNAKVLIDFSESSYPYQLSLSVPPKQIRTIDIKKLRDEQTPDVNKNTIPINSSVGGVQVFHQPGAFVASNPTFFENTIDGISTSWIASCPGGVKASNPNALPLACGGGGGGSPQKDWALRKQTISAICHVQKRTASPLGENISFHETRKKACERAKNLKDSECFDYGSGTVADCKNESVEL